MKNIKGEFVIVWGNYLVELKKYYGPDAQFREGQLEAIQGVLENKRSIVVQKTGWGKSLVYFMATKILRARNKGITLIISPLLALMNNQIESAKRLELIVRTINSENSNEEQDVYDEIIANEVDALIISPERLANEEFKKFLLKKLSIKIGLFVIDEVHCISDWGHDFRPDYRRIIDIVKLIPKNVPVLGTTATANDRVVEDIKEQLGKDIFISRGELTRDSIIIQVLTLNTREERLAWLLENINKLPGTGIIYCLTINDCKIVNEWLIRNNINSDAFYSDKDSEEKQLTVDRFMNNEIKVLVATVAFGMGFDKPDISFVIHYQKPGNIVAYYQQIGRAGRSIDSSYAILMCGAEDDSINQYFIDSAFPTEDNMNEVVQILTDSPGLRQGEIERYVNIKPSRLSGCLKYLDVNGDIYKENGKYYKTPRPWEANIERSKRITQIRENELREINEFINSKTCSMEFISKALNDTHPKKCGRCFNCTGKGLPSNVLNSSVGAALNYISENVFIIDVRKKWPIQVDGKYNINKDYINEQGKVLSSYGSYGWGKMVMNGKYEDDFFSDELVKASTEFLGDYVSDNDIRWVTNITSIRHPNLVSSFARRLADALGLKYVDCIEKVVDSQCQKNLNNSFHQFKNAYDSFDIVEDLVLPENVLLVDDMVDSRWTFTCCGYKLRMAGSGKVFPFALANSAGRGDS